MRAGLRVQGLLPFADLSVGATPHPRKGGGVVYSAGTWTTVQSGPQLMHSIGTDQQQLEPYRQLVGATHPTLDSGIWGYLTRIASANA